jgi:hypothetical protein
MPSLMESLLCFFGGALTGGLSLAAGGEGISGLISRLARGRLKITGDLAKKIVDKIVDQGFKESLSALLRRFRRNPGDLEEVLWWSDTGGDIGYGN